MKTTTTTGSQSKAKSGAKAAGVGGGGSDSKKAASKKSSAGGGTAGATPRFTPASLRRLLDAGVRLIEGNLGFYSQHHPFSAITLAAYFTMTARQSWAALDQLADEGLVRWIGTDSGYNERWQVTRNGLYVVQSYVTSKNRLQRKAAAMVSKRMSALASLPLKFDALERVIGWGPWMDGYEYGPAIIGLQVEDWAAIEAKSRLEMVIATLEELAVDTHMESRHVPNVVVMGFSSKDGVPWRLRSHQVLGVGKTPAAGGAAPACGGMVELGAKDLDVDECAYQAGLEDLAEKLGIWRRPEEDDNDEHHRRGDHADHLSWYSIGPVGFNPLEPPQQKPTAAELAAKRSLWSAQVALAMEVAAVRIAPCAAMRPKRRGKPSAAASAKERGFQSFAWREDESYEKNVQSLQWHLNARRYAPIDVGAHADAMREAGVTASAVQTYPWVLDAENRDGVDVVQAFDVLRHGWLRHIGVMQSHDKAVLKRQSPPKVVHFTLFCIGAGEPLPVAMVRQPVSQFKALRDAEDLALMGALKALFIRYGKPMAEYLGEHRGLSSLSWLMCGKRVSTTKEKAAYEHASRAAGRNIQFIRINHEGKAFARFRGLLSEREAESFGVESFDAPGELAVNLDWHSQAKKALDEARRAVGAGFFEDYGSWWIDPTTTSLKWVLQQLSDVQSVVGRRLRCAIWQPLSGREEHWIPDNDRVPSVKELEGGAFEVGVTFNGGSVVWWLTPQQAGSRSRASETDEELVLGHIELSYIDQSWRLPVAASYERARVMTLGLCLEILNALNMFNSDDPVALAKEVVPASMWGVKGYRRLAQAELDASANELIAQGRSRRDAYEAVTLGGEHQKVNMTDVQWLAGLVDSVMSRRNHHSMRWKQGMMDLVIGNAAAGSADE